MALYIVFIRTFTEARHRVDVRPIVLTLKESNDTASAVAIEDGRIQNVGDDETLLALANEAT